MNMYREESISFLFKFANRFERGSLFLATANRNDLDELSFGIIAPSMVATTNDWGAPSIFDQDWETTMTTDVMETAENSILSKG
jgi:hypothetical protein